MAAVALSESRDISQSTLVQPILFTSSDRSRDISSRSSGSPLSPISLIKKESMTVRPISVSDSSNLNLNRITPPKSAAPIKPVNLKTNRPAPSSSVVSIPSSTTEEPEKKRRALLVPSKYNNTNVMDPLAAVYQQHCDLMAALRDSDNEDDGSTVNKLRQLSQTQLMDRIKDVFNWSHRLSVDEAREIQRGRNLGIPCLVDLRMEDDDVRF